MADQTVKIINNDLSKVAYDMAISLWLRENKKMPKMSDENFYLLVSNCVTALKGSVASEYIRKRVEEYNK